MSQLVYKRFRRKGGGWQHVPYEIFTQEEATERGIVPLSRTDWRERFFDNHENLAGQYILTDDTPPRVTPVLRCEISNPIRPHGRGGYIKKLYLPWTHVMGRGRPVLFGVKVGVISQQLKSLYRRVTTNQRKLFILLVALGCGHHKAVFAIWGLDQKVDQNYFRKLIMSDEKTKQAAQGLAGEAFDKAGATPEAVAEELWELVRNEKVSDNLRLSGLQDIADRIGLKEKEEKLTDGFVGMAMLQEGPVHPQVTAGLAKKIAVKAGDDGKARVLIESQGEAVSDE